jgi:hypothetical protein
LSLGPDGVTLVISPDIVPTAGLSVALREDVATTSSEQASKQGRLLGPVILVTPALEPPAGKDFEVLVPRLPEPCADADVRLAYERPGDVGTQALEWRSEPARASDGAFTARLDRLWGMHLAFVCKTGGTQ